MENRPKISDPGKNGQKKISFQSQKWENSGKFSVLSTKKLTSSQKELLLNSGIGLVEWNFIKITPIDFQLEKIPENVIFTSQNSVRIVLEKLGKEAFTSKNIFCVGKKTAALLKRSGLPVKMTADYGKELAMDIQKWHSEEEFLFFCGKKRRPELPEFFKKYGIKLTEQVIYDTLPSPKHFQRSFDGILFFSPSGVKSFCSVSEIDESMLFCIGKTTAAEAEKHSKNIKIASRPSVENVLVQLIKYYKKNDQK